MDLAVVVERNQDVSLGNEGDSSFRWELFSPPSDVSRRWRRLANASARPRQLLGKRELTRPQEGPPLWALPAESVLPISRTDEPDVPSACLPSEGEVVLLPCSSASRLSVLACKFTEISLFH